MSSKFKPGDRVRRHLNPPNRFPYQTGTVIQIAGVSLGATSVGLVQVLWDGAENAVLVPSSDLTRVPGDVRADRGNAHQPGTPEHTIWLQALANDLIAEDARKAQRIEALERELDDMAEKTLVEGGSAQYWHGRFKVAVADTVNALNEKREDVQTLRATAEQRAAKIFELDRKLDDMRGLVQGWKDRAEENAQDSTKWYDRWRAAQQELDKLKANSNEQLKADRDAAVAKYDELREEFDDYREARTKVAETYLGDTLMDWYHSWYRANEQAEKFKADFANLSADYERDVLHNGGTAKHWHEQKRKLAEEVTQLKQARDAALKGRNQWRFKAELLEGGADKLTYRGYDAEYWYERYNEAVRKTHDEAFWEARKRYWVHEGLDASEWQAKYEKALRDYDDLKHKGYVISKTPIKYEGNTAVEWAAIAKGYQADARRYIAVIEAVKRAAEDS